MDILSSSDSLQIGAVLVGLLGGLALFLFGMDVMSQATDPLRAYPPFIDAMQRLQSPLTAVALSAAFTALVQSSSATTGVVIVLASQGFISLETGIALIFGANIGTCITALLAAIGKPSEAVQAASVHVLFNVLGVIVWFPFISYFADFIREMSSSAETPRQIANAHTVFNVTNMLLFLPFVSQFAWLARRIIPKRLVGAPAVIQPEYLDQHLLSTSDLALDRVRREIGRLGVRAQQMVWQSATTVLRGSEEDLALLEDMNTDVDTLQSAIIAYLGKLSQHNLLRDQTEELYDYMAVATYIENISDMAEINLVEAGRQRITHDVHNSAGTQEAIYALHEQVCRTVEQALEAVEKDDKATATQVIEAKPTINRLSDAIDGYLAQRLVAAVPNRLGAYRVESDVVENYRRIYYFAKRIAKAVVQEDMPRRVAAQELAPNLQT